LACLFSESNHKERNYAIACILPFKLATYYINYYLFISKSYINFFNFAYFFITNNKIDLLMFFGTFLDSLFSTERAFDGFCSFGLY